MTYLCRSFILKTDFLTFDKHLGIIIKCLCTNIYIKALNVSDDIASQVYILRGTVTIIESEFFTAIEFKDANGNTLPLYCSGAGQYSWAKEYSGQEVTVEFAICNWNNKTFWAGCLLSLTTDDGVKLNNTYNLAG